MDGEVEWEEHGFVLASPGFESGVLEKLIFDSPGVE